MIIALDVLTWDSNQRVGSDSFVLHGYNDKETGKNMVNVSWLTADKVKSFTDLVDDGDTLTWATGPASGYVACKEIAELKEEDMPMV